MRIFFLLLSAAVFSACNPLGSNGPTKDSTETVKPETGPDDVRPNPKTTPVAAFEQPVPNDLNKWFFRVQLYETKQRFVYRMVMQYEEVNQEKEISFPDLHMEPQPKIQKGAKDFEAIVGFLDDKGQFKEYIKVFADGGNLHLKTLKYYAVSGK